jgi:hypothetical protein
VARTPPDALGVQEPAQEQTPWRQVPPQPALPVRSPAPAALPARVGPAASPSDRAIFVLAATTLPGPKSVQEPGGLRADRDAPFLGAAPLFVPTWQRHARQQARATERSPVRSQVPAPPASPCRAST